MTAELSRLVEVAKGGNPWLDAEIDVARAALREVGGEYQEALRLLRQVIEVGDPLHLRLPTTLARIDAARCALASGLTDEAEMLLDEASNTAEWMGAKRLIDQIEELRSGASAAAAGG
jgi:hypothetical protein